MLASLTLSPFTSGRFYLGLFTTCHIYHTSSTIYHFRYFCVFLFICDWQETFVFIQKFKHDKLTTGFNKFDWLKSSNDSSTCHSSILLNIIEPFLIQYSIEIITFTFSDRQINICWNGTVAEEQAFDLTTLVRLCNSNIAIRDFSLRSYWLSHLLNVALSFKKKSA